MKKLIWLLPLMVIFSCSKEKRIRVSGTVHNSYEGTIYLDVQGLGESHTADSMKMSPAGRFRLSDRIEIPTFYNLHLGAGKIIPLLIHPGSHVEITTDAWNFASGYSVSGSAESQEMLELNETLSQTQSRIDSLRRLLEEEGEKSGEFLESINTAYEEIIGKQRNYSIQFVLDHHNSMVAIYALYQKINENDFILNENRDIQLLKVTADALDTIYPGSEYVAALKSDVRNLEEALHRQQWQNIYTESKDVMPDIRLPDPSGDTISLHSLDGKVVLLSFWASWNETSVALNLQLKNLYEKYKGQGFEIYQVSMDNQYGSWLDAIRFDELPWINVSELSYPESHVAILYNVKELPTTYLINREGRIVARNPGISGLDSMISGMLN